MKFKSWLTIDDAAKYLNALLSEPVEPKDILQLALDNHITLSLNFTEIVSVMEVSIKPFSEVHPEFPSDNYDKVNFKDDSYQISTYHPLHKINGLWDLKLFGAGEAYIKSRLLISLNKDEQLKNSKSSIYIQRDDKSYRLYEKLESYDEENELLLLDSFLDNVVKVENINPDDGYYKPMPNIPSHAILVVSLNSLKEFERKLENENLHTAKSKGLKYDDKPNSKVHSGALLIIAALAHKLGMDMDSDVENQININKINGLITDFGFTMKNDTIKARLSEIPEALQNRSKDIQGRPLKEYKRKQIT